MSVKNVLTEKFLGAIESMELVTRLIFLLPLTPSELRRPTLDYTSLQRKLLNEWDGGLIKKAIQHLLRSGYFKKAGKNKYFLTTKALGKILELRIKRKIKDKKKLKKQYLVLIFDIPEERRKTRNLFRHQLKELGFEMIQKSVWITQQDILREMKALIEFCELGEEVKFFIAEKA